MCVCVRACGVCVSGSVCVHVCRFLCSASSPEIIFTLKKEEYKNEVNERNVAVLSNDCSGSVILSLDAFLARALL